MKCRGILKKQVIKKVKRERRMNGKMQLKRKKEGRKERTRKQNKK